MRSSDDAERRFLASLHGYDPRAPERSPDAGAVKALLSADSAHRLRVYQESYHARLSTNLAETVLDRASELFGRRRVERLLVDYFVAHPPSSRLMTETLASLPSFAASHEWGTAAPHVVDVLRLALVRWRALIGPDPSPPATGGVPEELALTPDARLFEAETPAFSLWSADDGAEIADEPEACLVLKTSPTDLVMLNVDAVLLPFVRSLADGATIAAASVALADAAAPEFAPMLARLAAHGALRAQPPRARDR